MLLLLLQSNLIVQVNDKGTTKGRFRRWGVSDFHSRNYRSVKYCSCHSTIFITLFGGRWSPCLLSTLDSVVIDLRIELRFVIKFKFRVLLPIIGSCYLDPCTYRHIIIPCITSSITSSSNCGSTVIRKREQKLYILYIRAKLAANP